MNWCVIRHPDLGTAVVAEPSLTVHEPRGWIRVSEFVADRDSINLDEYTNAAPEPSPAPDAVPSKPAETKSAKPTTGKREH